MILDQVASANLGFDDWEVRMKAASYKWIASTRQFGVFSNFNCPAAVRRGQVVGHFTVNAIVLWELNWQIRSPAVRTI